MAPRTRANQAATDKSVAEATTNSSGKLQPKIQPNGSMKPTKKSTILPISKNALGHSTSRDLSEDVDSSPSLHVKSEKEDLVPRDNNFSSASKVTRQKKKKHPYGLTPGYSPFPDHASPTADDCRRVNELLSSIHGVVTQPAIIPPPSSTVTGCGEVPDLLDALLRTLLSSNTSNENSAKALKGLIDTFGSVGGSPNWELVRQADVQEVEDAIAAGGQQKNKSKYIKGILDIVYNENVEVYNNRLKSKDLSLSKDVAVKSQPSGVTKSAETNFKFLSLARIFEIKDTNEAMDELLKFPGIGVKTASCVIMFCMQRPSFAVDTHVHRFCQWLGWAPAGCSENNTFSHLEVRVPNELKYSLHHLFIKHGQRCFRCKANTNSSSNGWDDCVCPIEDLVIRTGKMKDFHAISTKKIKPAHKKVESGRVAKTKSAKARGKKSEKVKKSDESEIKLDLDSTESDDLSDLDMSEGN